MSGHTALSTYPSQSAESIRGFLLMVLDWEAWTARRLAGGVGDFDCITWGEVRLMDLNTGILWLKKFYELSEQKTDVGAS